MTAPSLKSFQLLAGHPALDLVNTLDNRFMASGTIELLPGYQDVLRFVQQSGLLNPKQSRLLVRRASSAAAAAVTIKTHGLREALAQLFYPSSAAARAQALHTVQQFAIQAGTHRSLKANGATQASLAEWAWDFERAETELPLWMLAQTAHTLIVSGESRRVRSCCRDTCQWLFLDSSKNHSRRWCDMQVCGNRVKAQRYKAAHSSHE